MDEAAVTDCTRFPEHLVLRQGCPDVNASSASALGVIACSQFASPADTELTLFWLVVFRGPARFAELIRVPSVREILDAGSLIDREYAQFEGPAWIEISAGRRVKLEARSMFLGGSIHWGTLASPHGTYELTFAVNFLLHDCPVNSQDRAALDSLDLPQVIACLGSKGWP
jgi:hypothetical protein